MSEQKTCTACSENSREAIVSWGDPDFTFMGRVNDSFTWNGWFVPAFTAAEARRIMRETQGVAGLDQISELEGERFQIASDDAAPDSSAGWSVVISPTECCGLYFIGDWWTWDELKWEDLQPWERAFLRNADF